MTRKVKKAVIAAAGFGTRFLPATKAMPKEMLPLVDKPIIQYVVEDIVSAGIEDIAIVTGWHKRSIEDHFDYPFELEKRLLEWGKPEYIQQVRAIADMANFHYIRQKGPYGNGTPIWNARSFIGDDPFLYVWADDFITASPTRSQQLVAAYEQSSAAAVLGGIHKSAPEDYKRYAYIEGESLAGGSFAVQKMVEKPGVGNIDSNLAIVSGFVFGPEMVGAVGKAMQQLEGDTSGRELYYTDAVNILMQEGKQVLAQEITNAKYYDCGNKLEYLKAVVEFGLAHEDLRDEFAAFLKGIA